MAEPINKLLELERGCRSAHMEVTRELVQLIPTQPSPQGSSPTQLDGLFCHKLPSELRAAAT